MPDVAAGNGEFTQPARFRNVPKQLRTAARLEITTKGLDVVHGEYNFIGFQLL
jgi:hypothetical protein